MNSSDTLYIADQNQRIRKAVLGGGISTVAGNGTVSYTATTTASGATLFNPNAAAPDSSGNLYIADTANCLVWKATASGAISLLAGTPPSAASNYQPVCGYTGDGGGHQRRA